MKQEVYSCLKMLEAFNYRTILTFNTRIYDSANSLKTQYIRIYGLLCYVLNSDQIQFIPYIPDGYVSSSEQIGTVQELISASSIAISYLRSLDMDLDKELRLKKEELAKKEKELELREKEVESLKRLLDKSIEATKQLPELGRSRVVEAIKKSHREIEKHSRLNNTVKK